MRIRLLLILILIPCFVFSQPMQRMMKSAGAPFGMRNRLADILELTDAQKEEIRQLKLDHQKKSITVGADLKLASIELMELMSSDASEKKIFSEVENINKLKNKLFEMRIKLQLDMKKLLTDEQKTKLKEHPNLLKFERNINRDRKLRMNCPGHSFPHNIRRPVLWAEPGK